MPATDPLEVCFRLPVCEKLFRLKRRDVHNSVTIVAVDALLSRAFAWNVNYHPRNVFDLFRPSSAFFLRKCSSQDQCWL
jgi:hypothetical protein